MSAHQKCRREKGFEESPVLLGKAEGLCNTTVTEYGGAAYMRSNPIHYTRD
jgi:hypothetical protein